jgi:hypothetical protein
MALRAQVIADVEFEPERSRANRGRLLGIHGRTDGTVSFFDTSSLFTQKTHSQLLRWIYRESICGN